MTYALFTCVPIAIYEQQLWCSKRYFRLVNERPLVRCFSPRLSPSSSTSDFQTRLRLSFKRNALFLYIVCKYWQLPTKEKKKPKKKQKSRNYSIKINYVKRPLDFDRLLSRLGFAFHFGILHFCFRYICSNNKHCQSV